jgi:hypothetical protein
MPNKYKKLQIKEISPSGQLLSCINVFAGQVTVFRATSNEELFPYVRSLAGMSGPEKFIIELDGEAYLPTSHSLIGFGERFNASDNLVSDFLKESGVPNGNITSLLYAYGLDDIYNAKCIALSRCQERRLRLLAAAYSRNKILVVNDPFDPISGEWRERFAELLLQLARNQSQIVLVPNLSYRPQAWIDNEAVARVQVGQNIQKTVGFSNQSSSIQSMIIQIRETLQKEQELDKDTTNQSSDNINSNTLITKSDVVPQTFPSQSISRKQALSSSSIVANNAPNTSYEENPPEEFIESTHKAKLFTPLALTSLVCLMLCSVFLYLNWPKDSEVGTISSLPNQSISNNINLTPENTPLNANQPQIAPVSAQNIEPSPIETPPETNILDSYPPNIKEAVLRSFSKDSFKHAPNDIHNSKNDLTPKLEKKNEAGDILKLLQSASEPDETNIQPHENPNIETSVYPNAIEPVDEQERREQIRQKFLEAIQRAQDQRDTNIDAVQ